MPTSTRSRRRVVASTAMLVLVLLAFAWAASWQLDRALSGNALSWAYVIEWPLLGLYAVYFWWKDLFPKSARAEAAAPSEQAAQDLAAYNAYLRQLHDRDAPAAEPRGPAAPERR